MKVSTMAGCADRDYILLEAETVKECAALVRVSQSRFIPLDAMRLDANGSIDAERVELRVFVGPPKQLAFDQETRSAIDATP